MEIQVTDSTLKAAAEAGMDEFLACIIQAVKTAIGGELNAENMPRLNADQITLLAWDMLHEEVMDGGFVQLIHNGYGPFMYRNPVARAFREWQLPELYRLLNRSEKFYCRHREELEKPCNDEEFMALFERFSEFDELDDEFVENEELWTARIACYVDDHLDNFVAVTDGQPR